jgi:hypothetical protein
LRLGKPGLRGWEVGIDWRARVGGFGSKRKNRATRAQFSQMNHGGPLRWVEGTYLGRGKPGLRGWEVGIDWRTRVGGFGSKRKNRATGAQFSQMNHGGPLRWVEGTYLGRGKPGLRGWEVGIDRCARGGCFGLTTQNRAPGLQFLRKSQGGLGFG